MLTYTVQKPAGTGGPGAAISTSRAVLSTPGAASSAVAIFATALVLLLAATRAVFEREPPLR